MMKPNALQYKNCFVPKFTVLYSTRADIKPCHKFVLPHAHILQKLSTSQSSARKLVKLIFHSKLPNRRIKKSIGCSKSPNSLTALKIITKSGYIKNNRKRNCHERDAVDETSSSSKRFCKDTFGYNDAMLIDVKTNFQNTFEFAIQDEAPQNIKSSVLNETARTAFHCDSNSQFLTCFGVTAASWKKDYVSTAKSSTKIHIPRKWRKAIRVCSTILKNFKTCNIKSLLNAHCPLLDDFIYSESVSGRSSQELVSENKVLLQMHCSSHLVFLFLRSAIQSILPCHSIWGSHQNENNFFKNLENILMSRVFDKTQYSDLLKNISTDQIPWLPEREQTDTLLVFLKWFVIDCVFVLMKKLFYVTEHAKYKNRLFYYRHEVWKRITDNGVAILCQNNVWDFLPQNTGAFHTSFRVRFCPKSAGLRPIMSCLKATQQLQISARRSSEVLKILKYICSKHPIILGCSTSGLDDVHEQWKYYWMQQKAQNVSQLYFVKVDINRCFETIPANKLLKILRQLLDRAAATDISSVSKKFKKVSDCGNDLYRFFEASLKDITITMQSKKYKKIRGIPQGWCLSSLLCDIFYGNMEAAHWPALLRSSRRPNTATTEEKQQTLLLRFVDDFLFVSPNRNDALDFLKKMHEGFPEYGCYINSKKTVVNFDVAEQDKTISVLPRDAPFPWFGLLFSTTVPPFHEPPSNPRSARFRGVALDLRKYEEIGNIRDCMTVDHSASARIAMKRLRRNMKMRTAAICFDLQVNSRYQVLRNLYELALLATLQWLGHDLARTARERLSERPGEAILGIKRLATASVLAVIRKKIPGQKFVTRSVILWIFYKAFVTKLARYSSVYDRLRQMLKTASKQLSTNWQSANLMRRKSLLIRATSTFPSHLSKVTVK